MTPEDKASITRMIPAIPETAWAREAALLEIARRCATGDDGVDGTRKMQVYFVTWLDALIEAGVDVRARNADGEDCIAILGRRKHETPGLGMAQTMVKRLIDAGYPFVGSHGSGKLRGRLLTTALEHLARRARTSRGALDRDENGNSVLHEMTLRQPALLQILFRAMDANEDRKKRAPTLFRPEQATPNNEGETPLHMLWTPVRAIHDSSGAENLWVVTRALCLRYGLELDTPNQRGETVLDLIDERANQGMLPELDPSAKQEAKQMQAATWQQIMEARTVNHEPPTRRNHGLRL